MGLLDPQEELSLLIRVNYIEHSRLRLTEYDTTSVVA